MFLSQTYNMRRPTKMKRIIKTGNKTVIMAIIAAMCLTGCAGEKGQS